MLPLKLEMRDLNGNEKVIELAKKLPGEASNPGTIREGDLMVWSSRSPVLFYKTFPTSYSYARLGRIAETAGLRVFIRLRGQLPTVTRRPESQRRKAGVNQATRTGRI